MLFRNVLIVIIILALFVLLKLKLSENQQTAETVEDFHGGRRGGGWRHRGRHRYPRRFPRRYGYNNYRPFWWPIASWFSPMGGRYCQDCGYKSRGGCSTCANCVYAINQSGSGNCVAGDKQKGPYFQEDAIYWE